MALVAPLGAFGRADIALAGGKGANLGELIRAGFPVPGGFVVTTEAYAAVAPGTSGLDGAALRARFESLTVPDDLRAQIARAYADAGRPPVAVRSSATAEDLPGAAFAGQQDTYLNVIGETALIDAVRRCWASLWTDRAIAYRDRRGIAHDEVRIAVVVQRMIDAELAGVMFTADPVTGRRDRTVIDASGGLGEAVVSGLVTPDHYVLDPRGRLHEFAAGRREVVVRSTAGGGVAHSSGESAAPAERLPRAALAELARLGARAARHFGTPQDIEWAYADGRLSLLQARPMTALPPPPIRLGPAGRRLAATLLEMLPVRPYPIDMTTWIPHGPAGLMARLTEYFGVRGAFEGFLVEEDGVVTRLAPSTPRPTIGVLRAPYRLFSLARRYDPARWTEDPRFAAWRSSADRLAAEDLAAMPWARLIRVPRQALDLVRPLLGMRTSYLPGVGRSLVRLLLTLAGLRRRKMFGDLVLGADTRTAAANRALAALAEPVRADAGLRDAVEAADLDRLKGYDAFWADFTDFLREYGHRETASPILVTPPTWGEVPEVVLGLIKVLAADPPAATDRAGEALARLLDHPRLRRDPGRRERVLRQVLAARAGMAFREDTHFYFTKPLPVLRRALLEIGRRLCEVGVLDDAEEVFHLRLEELEEIADPQVLKGAAGGRLRSAVRARAARRAELAGVPLLDPALIHPPRDHGDALVSGTPAGGGSATGPVRIVREPAEFGRLAGGDVLVCPYTNPSWTPLFQRAAAVVVDSGSAASHAAIVAREYGIPAVMGTGRGTAVLKDGQLVTVDGRTGRVTAAAP
ncbi:phosphoenolpyruvate synthase [Spongiactinospora rosea]|uniref:Phosphoenolpyruvate synthase n=1 Tax=Spongiactinospora rosea TaxID=2248750 RepID=A0A366M2E2_9ACTN|nr:PEP/pyruvate-binding domain-containing protein [Spongiactinospora rosea]RBQ20408.1 phosphoenolpyruvate synthase [Spongiactinospora rosea]